MNIILGFGPHHVDVTRDFARRLGHAVLGCDRDAIKETAEAFCASVPDHVGKAGRRWSVARVRILCVDGYDAFPCGDSVVAESRAVTVEVRYCHFRNDHPMSPDGFAMWEHLVAVVAMRCGVYPARVYTSMDGAP